MPTVIAAMNRPAVRHRSGFLLFAMLIASLSSFSTLDFFFFCGTGLNGLPCLVFVNSAARGDLASYASATMTGGVAAQLVWMPVVPSVAAIRERSGRPFGNMRACAKRACAKRACLCPAL